MINCTQLVEIIKRIDDEILIFNKSFSTLSNNFKINYDDSTSISIFNERTMSYLCNNLIVNVLKDYKYNVKICVNELYIKLEKKIKKEILNELCKEIGYIEPKTKLNKFYVDGFLLIENLYFEGDNFLFLEYKMNSKFIFSDLALDFLKFKVYTYYNDKNSIFVYSIFSKDTRYPTILNSCDKKYCLLKKTISESEIKENKIFVYLNNSNNLNEISKKDIFDNSYDSNSEIYKIDGLYSSFDNINKIGEEVEKLGDLNDLVFNEEEKLLLEISKNFNNKVINSSLVKCNYKFIDEIYKKIVESRKNDPIIQMNSLTEFKRIMQDRSVYWKNYLGNLTENQKNDAYKNGLRVSTYNSLFLLNLLDYYVEKKQMSINTKPIYFTRILKSGRRRSTLDYEEVSKEIKNKLNKYYYKEDNLNNLMNLAESLCVFISKYYHAFYVIDDESKVVDKKPKRKFQECGEALKENVNKICALLNCSKPKYTSQNILFSANDVLAFLCSWIIKKYS